MVVEYSAQVMRTYMSALNETEQQSDIAKIMRRYFKLNGTWTVDAIGVISVTGDCDLRSSSFDSAPGNKLPVNFATVSGYFYAIGCKLTTLEGSPHTVGGRFDCSDNYLTSLKGAPKRVSGSFSCNYNNLVNFKGGPEQVDGSYNCRHIRTLTSLEGLPEHLKGGEVALNWSDELPLLRLVGKMVYIDSTAESRKAAKTAEDIINKYTDNVSRANILACQKDLINAGLEGNASW